MRVVLDRPQTIHKLRKIYNDKVTFITSVQDYPFVKVIEFDGDYNGSLKKRRVPVRVSRRVSREIQAYGNELTSVWDKTHNRISGIVRTVKDPKKRQSMVREELSSLRDKLQGTSKKSFEDMYKLGKIRGQILSDQEFDDDLNTYDRKVLVDRAEWNKRYIDRLTDDLWIAYVPILEREARTDQDVGDAVKQVKDVESKQRRRLPLFAAAVGSVLLGAGTVAASKKSKDEPTEDEDDFEIFEPVEGGYWHTRHDNRVCPGCEELDGKWLTMEEFQAEVGTNQCLTRCRCVELFEPAPREDDNE